MIYRDFYFFDCLRSLKKVIDEHGELGVRVSVKDKPMKKINKKMKNTAREGKRKGERREKPLLQQKKKEN